jgi:hypothetical protein
MLEQALVLRETTPAPLDTAARCQRSWAAFEEATRVAGARAAASWAAIESASVALGERLAAR